MRLFIRLIYFSTSRRMPSSFSVTQGSCIAAKGQGSGPVRAKLVGAAFFFLIFLSLPALLRADTGVVVVSVPSANIGTNGEVNFAESSLLPAGAEVVGVDLNLEYSTYWPPSNPAFAGNYVQLNGASIDALGWLSFGNNNGWTAVSPQFRGSLPAYIPGAQNTWKIGSAYNPINLRNLTIRVYYLSGVVNRPPSLAPIARSGFVNTTVAFVAADFTAAYTDPESTAVASITVASLPASGMLKLSGSDVTAGQVIPAANLGQLTYVPALNATGAVTFTVTASDGALSSAAATVTITLVTPPDETPPVLTSVSIASSNSTPTLAKPGDTITVTFTANEPLGPPATATLRGWYPLDGNGYDPTATGPTLTQPGQSVAFASGLVGQAASFDGTGNTWLRSAISASGDTNPTFTWGTWAKLTDTVTWSILISNDNNEWDRFLSSHDGKWTLPKGDTLESPYDVTTAWTFLAVTYDGTTQRLYVDGNPVFTAPDPGNQPMQPFIEIGRNANGSYPINGLIDGVFFFDDTLTAAQIATIRAGGPGGSGVFKIAGKPVVATIAGRPATVAQVSGTTWSASLTLAATDPAGPVAFSLTCIDAAGNVAAPVTTTTNGSAVQADIMVPAVVAITRQTPSPTGATSASYAVTFTESVTGVDASDFALTVTGATSASIGSVTGSGTIYLVTVNSIVGGGTLRLDLKPSGTGIADSAGNLVATGFTAGEVYTINGSAPTLTTPASATIAEDATFDFTGASGVVVGDIDNNLSTLSIIASNGTLTLTGSPSTTNTGLGTGTVAFTGSVAAINASIATLRYTPDADYNGSATVTFVAIDSTALTLSKAVALTIIPVSDIVSDALTTAEDTPITANLLTGTNGASADTFKSSAAFILSVTQGAHGAVTFAGNGTVTYTPALNFNGADSFTYMVASGFVTETGVVTVNVSAVNDAPVNTVPGAQSVNANTPLAFSAPNGNAISIADPDFANVAPEIAEPFKFSVTLNATDGFVALGSTTGITFTSGTGAPNSNLSFNGSLSAVNAALSTLSFLPTPGFSGAASLTISTSDNSNSGSGGALTDTDTIAIKVIDTIPPVVVSLTSLTPDGHYRAGGVIDLAVTFSEMITVDSKAGAPTLLLETGATDRTATYVSGSGSSVLVFRYVVAPGDTAEDLNHQSSAALLLNGARLQDPAGNDAILALPSTAPGTPGALATSAALVIDTTAPDVSISTPSAPTVSFGPVTYTITYADAHFSVSTLSVADITLNRTSTDERLVTPNATVTVGGSGLTRTVTLSSLTGDGLLSISLAAGTAADLAGNPASAVGPTAAITVQNTFPVAISQPPVSTAVAVGMPLMLRVIATGTAPTYQWYKDTLPIEGATKPTLEFAATPLSAAGSYRVTVSNVLGSAESASATVGVVDVAAAHAIDGPGYVPGQIVTVRNVVTFAGGDGTLTWSLLLPPGWSYAGGDLAGDTRPAVGATDLLEWSWLSFPISPVTFAAQVQVPASAKGSQVLAAHVSFTRGAVTVPLLAKPDPLVLAEIGIHSADTDRNGRFSLVELLRVIELYNTRAGTLRTGSYAVASGPSEDGFAPALTRPPGVITSLEVYHTADTDRDGALSLLELTRVIELYNCRQGTLRTGEYHRQAGTEDGFASGPGGPLP